MAKSKEAVIRKLPLPLQIRLGADGIVTDGFFSVTGKDAGQINITEIGADGYATLEILPTPKLSSMLKTLTIPEPDSLLGMTTSKTRGSGEDFGQYRYYKRLDGTLYAVVSGKKSRKIQLGEPTDRKGRIFTVARVIAEQYVKGEFTKKELIPKIPKRLSYGQTLKALLDVMTIEGYLEKREKEIRGKMRELFKATDKLSNLVFSTLFISSKQT